MAKYKVTFYGGHDMTGFERDLNEEQPDSIESLIWSPKESDSEVAGFMAVLRWEDEPKNRGLVGE
jgi:hypothetical protein